MRYVFLPTGPDGIVIDREKVVMVVGKPGGLACDLHLSNGEVIPITSPIASVDKALGNVNIVVNPTSKGDVKEPMRVNREHVVRVREVPEGLEIVLTNGT